LCREKTPQIPTRGLPPSGGLRPFLYIDVVKSRHRLGIRTLRVCVCVYETEANGKLPASLPPVILTNNPFPFDPEVRNTKKSKPPPCPPNEIPERKNDPTRRKESFIPIFLAFLSDKLTKFVTHFHFHAGNGQRVLEDYGERTRQDKTLRR